MTPSGMSRPPLSTPAHDIVVGNVLMDRLQAQLRHQGLNFAHRTDHRLGNALAQVHVGHGRKQVQRDRPRPSEVPLQLSFEPRMIEILECGGELSRNIAECRHRFSAQVPAARQRATLEIGEQADMIGLLANGCGDDVLTAERGHHFRHFRRAGLCADMPQCGILGFDLHPRIFDARYLQNETPFVCVDAEVAILLAAEFGKITGKTVVLGQDRLRFVGRHVRSCKLRPVLQQFVYHPILPVGQRCNCYCETPSRR